MSLATPDRAFLGAFQAHLLSTGLPAEVLEHEGPQPFPSLVSRLPEVGRAERALHLELSAPPGIGDATSGTFLLQVFVVVSSGAPLDRHDDLVWLTNMLNTRLALGAFGLMQDTGTVFYKLGLVIDGAVDAQTQVRLVDLQCGLMIHMLHTFTDLLVDVAEGKNAVDALRAHPLGAVFAMAG